MNTIDHHIEKLREKPGGNPVPDWMRIHFTPEYKELIGAVDRLGLSKSLDVLIGIVEPMPTDMQFRQDIYGPIVKKLREAKEHYDRMYAAFLEDADKPPAPTEDTVVLEPTWLGSRVDDGELQ